MPALANATMFHGITETLQPKRSVANRTNQVMKVLIVLGAVALPALVISMLYGMMSMKCVFSDKLGLLSRHSSSRRFWRHPQPQGRPSIFLVAVQQLARN
jgi:hypothetical protein